MKCTLCEKEISDTEEAIEAGWFPSFWVGEAEYGEVCDSCLEKYIQEDGNGDFELKPEFVATFLASASSRDFFAKMTLPYPNEVLIARLRAKFLEHTIDSLTRSETIDLINNMHEQIRQLKEK